MTTEQRRQERVLGVMPVVAALAVHATSHANAWIASAVGVALSIVVFLDITLQPSRVRFLFLAGGGVAVGTVMSALGVTPPLGPLPPLVWFALVGLMLGLTCEFVAHRKIAGALGTALGLVVLSLNVELTTPVVFALCIFVASFLASTAALTGTMRMEWRFLLPFSAFVATSTALTIGIAHGVQWWEGTLDRVLSKLFIDSRVSAQMGMGQDVTLTARHELTPSLKPLLELSAPVERLRSQVLDTFDGRRWTISPELFNSTRTLDQVPARAESARTVELAILDDLNGRLPAPAAIWQIRGALPRIDGAWTMRDNQSSPRVVMTGDGDERLPTEPSPAEHLLALPEELRRELAPLARSILRDSRSDREKALRIERYFRENFTYSLDTNLVGDDHPLVVLVRQRRAASCTYFASAMAVMLRSQGVSTRLVLGFAPAEVNPWTGRVLVRERDAHAWVEAWIADEERFVAFEPTPWPSRDAALGLDAKPGIVAALVTAGGSLARQLWLAVEQDPLGTITRFLRKPWFWLASMLVTSLWWWQRRTRRRRPVPRVNLESDDPVLRKIYARYLDALRRLGVQPEPWETDDELIARLAEQCGESSAGKARDFVRRYRQMRFRGDPCDANLASLATLS